MKLPFIPARSLILAASIAVACGAEAKELSLIRATFDNPGVDADARGVARAIFTPNNPKFRLDLFGLTPAATYQLSVDGILEETLVADARGGVHADFRLNGTGTKLPLDFDPRDAVLGILDENGEVLSVVFSGEGEPDDIRVDERTTLLPLLEEEGGRVELRYLEQKNKDRFIVHFLGLERGTYEFYVDGQLQAEIDLNKGRSTMRSFELMKNGKANPGVGKGKKVALDFDPRGLIVDVVREGTLVFSGEMLAQIPGLEEQVGEANLVLTSTGVDADATGSALLHRDADGELSLQVQVGALPAGTYDVVVGGVIVGTITVTGLEPDGLATVVFSTEPEAGEFLLDFDVFGETIEVKQGATVFLNGTLPLTLTELAPPTTVETELPLLNQGVIATASSHITLTTTGTTLDAVEVELTGVPAGPYDFRVGTEIQGTIVVSDVNGVLVGELRFSADADDEPLDFDPTGLTVTIEQGGTVLLTRPL
jgi:hypothetical protein